MCSIPLNSWPARRYLQNTQKTQETNIYALSEIRTHNLSNPAAADLRLRQQGHRDRLMKVITVNKSMTMR